MWRILKLSDFHSHFSNPDNSGCDDFTRTNKVPSPSNLLKMNYLLKIHYKLKRLRNCNWAGGGACMVWVGGWCVRGTMWTVWTERFVVMILQCQVQDWLVFRGDTLDFLKALSIYAYRYPLDTLIRIHEPYEKISKWQVKQARAHACSSSRAWSPSWKEEVE